MSFVSGLPDPRDEPPPLDPRGYAALMRIRERAEEELRSLAPLTHHRFDGAEHLEPDLVAVRACAAAADIKRLIDAIVSDRVLAATLTARLGRGRRA
jgi:hypothetical protein